MRKKLNWQAYSVNDRNETIEKVKEAISRNDGYILNFNMFSDLALSLHIEIEENRIIDLHSALKGIIKLSDIDVEKILGTSRKEWFVFLNISFSKGKGELKTKVPAVPG